MKKIAYSDSFTEAEGFNQVNHGTLSVGIDIGTTTISAVVYDVDRKEQLESYTIPHDSYVFIGSSYYSEQSVSVIMDKAEKLLDHILKSYSGIVSIGLTGQMHGIIYVDEQGNALSNLINWQDKRADQPIIDGKTVCEVIKSITGESVSTGYGIATHYYNVYNGLVPQNAIGFCSIMDFLGMKICGLKRAVIHTSVAASFGLFDIKEGKFMEDKLSLIGIEKNFLPCVTTESVIIGKCRDIPVSVALGDNQSNFLGSVGKNEDSILVNIGTGSQLSAVSEYREPSADIELRPFIEGKYIACGSALCGGFAYSMLENFFRSYAVSSGMQEASQYTIINQLAQDAYDRGENGLEVDVSFLGKRSDPDCRGSIKMIGRQNFTPGCLALGVLKGMCNELYGFYEALAAKKTHVVASGGAVRQNPLLRKLIEDRFDMTVSVNSVQEEAATGAALFSAFVIKKIKYDNGFSEYISYV